MIRSSFSSSLAFTALIFFTAISSALASTEERLAKIYEMRTSSYAILSDFYMLRALEGDLRYSHDIDAKIKLFERSLGEFNQIENTKSVASGTMKTDWQKYKQLVDSNRAELLSQGYSNINQVNQLEDKLVTLNANLVQNYNALIEADESPVNKWTQQSRDMTLIIRIITAEYAARSSPNAAGQVYVSKFNVGGLEKQAKEFNRLLSLFTNAPSNDKAVNKTIKQIGVKWAFIEKSVTNFNQNAVPFIVSSYSQKITNNLKVIGDYYATKK